jgi:outer membrane protein OmpA-like peptidoglycan-associated protein
MLSTLAPWAALLFMSLATPAYAQAPRSDASVEEIVNALVPAPRTRSLGRNLNVEPARIDLTIQFDFDSATLRDESKPQLERLAQALMHDRLSSLRFQVEGHTDAQGTAAYNESLSARRANAVVTFLAEQGVERGRLQALGKGFAELLDPADPRGSKNRRVRVLTLE